MTTRGVIPGDRREGARQNRSVRTRVVDTCLGPVEVALTPGKGEVVLFFPGGHATAATPLCTDLYTSLGYRALVFSRPGYGRTNVGSLTAAEFIPAIARVCERLGIISAAATVGLSFGGLQAVHVAVRLPHFAPRLILHSCAPSSLPYPDSYLQRVAGPLVFGPRSQRLTWRIVRALTSSDRGLRAMMAPLSTLPTGKWWDRWTPADRAAARKTFSQMDSGSGFVTDVRQACAARSAYREAVLRSVPCPTLVTASRHDGGVAFTHAEDFVRTIPGSRLADTGAWSHLFWLGASRLAVSELVRTFLTESASHPPARSPATSPPRTAPHPQGPQG
jgi:pimeloyl-ACP methyl ester carboxylesterase